jgi:hypothetical protein
MVSTTKNTKKNTKITKRIEGIGAQAQRVFALFVFFFVSLWLKPRIHLQTAIVAPPSIFCPTIQDFFLQPR